MENGISVAQPPLLGGALEVRGPRADAGQTGSAPAPCKKKTALAPELKFFILSPENVNCTNL